MQLYHTTIEAVRIHCKNKRVDVTHLGLSELHNNVHTSRSVTFLEHYMYRSARRYTVKLSQDDN